MRRLRIISLLFILLRFATADDELTRNYASNECGAKVIAANPESEGTFKILSESKDEYMLNPCKAKIWFVVELCEPIQVTAIELANFELYSSTPKELIFQGSDKYPTTEWVHLGTFEATESRDLQKFEIKPLFNQYIKHIRIALNSFYGSEHFCPVSLIRVFGLSLAEEFDMDQGVQAPQPQTTNELTVDNASVVGPDDITLGVKSTEPEGCPADNVNCSRLKEPAIVDPLPDIESQPQTTTEGPGTDPTPPTSKDADLLSSESNSSQPELVTSVVEVVAPPPVIPLEVLSDKEITETMSPTPVISNLPTVMVPSTPSPETLPTVLSPSPVADDGPISSAASEVAFITTQVLQDTPTDAQISLSTESVISSSEELISTTLATTTSVPEVVSTQIAAPPPSVPLTTNEVPKPVVQGPAHVFNDSYPSPGSVIAASSSKESIFIKLNNRIKILEQNMSASNRRQELLEQKIAELYNKTMEKEASTYQLITDLQTKMTEINEKVYLLVAEKEVLQAQLIQVHIVFVVIQMVIMIIILNRYLKKMSREAAAEVGRAVMAINTIPTASDEPKTSTPIKTEPAQMVNGHLSHVHHTPTVVRPLFIRQGSRTPLVPHNVLLSPSATTLHHPLTGSSAFRKNKKKRRKKKKFLMEEDPLLDVSDLVL